MNHKTDTDDSKKPKNSKETNVKDQTLMVNGRQFIPSGLNPDNGKFFEGNHNPLSSKGD